ncbi:MAG TPA: immunoglobulin domain-containing protein, partial [Phycisphaerales bacterium]|nr:immunoglobulin domain-containing protein [Phycisphaerales bacterium]
NGPGRCLTVHQGRVYVGGDFTSIGSVPAGRLASSDGTTWSGVSSINGPVTALRSHLFNQLNFSPSLIVGGSFTQVGATLANRIAARDPVTLQWTPLGSGLNGPPLAFAALNNGLSDVDLIVGGSFTSAGGLSANRVARWNGSAWSAFGTGASGDVMALAVYNGQIVMGGAFTNAGGQPRNFVARWDPAAGGSWQPLGSGTNGTVRALAVLNGMLYAGGDFTTAGGNPASRVAVWNGSAWAPVGDGFNAPVHTLVAIDGTIAAGGAFTASGPAGVYRMAQWNGTSWLEIGSSDNAGVGADDTVLALLANGQDLHAAGHFQTVDGQFSASYARAVGTPAISVVSQPESAEVCPGGSAAMTFGVDTGWHVPAYQWRRNGVALSDGADPSGVVYSGVNTPTLLIDSVQAGPSALFHCRATTACGQSVESGTAVLAVASCCPADLGGQGGVPGADGVLDNNDFIVFIDYFFNQDARADVGAAGGVPGQDNAWDNNDFVVYIDSFFAGC